VVSRGEFCVMADEREISEIHRGGEILENQRRLESRSESGAGFREFAFRISVHILI
jgi:hypothetical protein